VALVEKPSLANLMRSHAGVYLTLGLGALLVSALRASRQVVIPLWADHLAINPAAASIIYGLAAAIDMAVFYPAGKVMDQYGRIWVALPSTLLMGLSLMLMPLTSGLPTFLAASMAVGRGNGIGSGIVMTLGADASPRSGRTEFLGIWRMLADVGASSGPVLLAAITALSSLAAGMVTIGGLGLVAALVFWRWIPAPDSRRE
jgi:MFS family permease